ncbi:MAG: hypothetical protein KC620_19860 [Myxococcales bacterium]|nr:hypothetical protein [Myxococcales bacterium]
MRRLALCLLLTACGAAPDPFAARYPTARYLVAEGTGATPEAAAASARARIAEQIAAKLHSVLEVESQGGDQATERTRQRIEVEARFERAELIRIPPEAAMCDPTGCRARAVLARQAAADALGADYDRAAVPFRQAAAAAETAAALALADVGRTETTLVFTRELRAAEAAFHALPGPAWRLRAVTDRPHAPFLADRQRALALEARRGQVLRSVAVSVDPLPKMDAALAEVTTAALLGALHALGVEARIDATCAGLALTPRAEVTCDRNGIGARCALHLDARLQRCADPAPLAHINFAAAGLVGVDPRSEDAARRRLAERIVPAALAGPLAEALRATLPLAR